MKKIYATGKTCILSLAAILLVSCGEGSGNSVAITEIIDNTDTTATTSTETTTTTSQTDESVKDDFDVFINAIIENENIWNNGFFREDTLLFFRDLDFDGDCEFLTDSYLSGAYDYADGMLFQIGQQFEPNSATLDEADVTPMTLYYNPDTKKYINLYGFEASRYCGIYEYVYQNRTGIYKGIAGYIEKETGNGIERWEDLKRNETISQEEYRNIFSQYLDGYHSAACITKPFTYGEYSQLSREEKYNLLKDSYQAFRIDENTPDENTVLSGLEEQDIDWVESYHDILYEEADNRSECCYFLDDLTQNGLPELIVSTGESTADCAHIYTIDNFGKAIQVKDESGYSDFGNYGGVLFVKETKTFISEVFKTAGDGSHDIIGYSQLNNQGIMQTIHTVMIDYDWNSNITGYTIDGKAATEAEYKEIVKKYGDTRQITQAGSPVFDLDMNGISEALQWMRQNYQ